MTSINNNNTEPLLPVPSRGSSWMMRQQQGQLQGQGGFEVEDEPMVLVAESEGGRSSSPSPSSSTRRTTDHSKDVWACPKSVIRVSLASVVVIVAIAVIVWAVVRVVPTSSGFTGFFHLADIHYDSLYVANCSVASACKLNQTTGTCERTATSRPLGAYGCDPGLALLTSALRAMAAVDPSPAFVLLTGDFLSHSRDPSEVDRDLQDLRTVSEAVMATFPPSSVPAFPAIGNNDFPAHWCLPVGPSPWLSNLTEIWSPWLTTGAMKATFSAGGYYSSEVSPTLRVVVLNTIYYATNFQRYCNPNGTLPDDPVGQLAWLRAELQAATDAGQRALLVGHVPPSMNPYDDSANQWADKYLASYFELVEGYRSVADVQLFSHLHRDAVRVLSTAGPASPSFSWGPDPSSAYSAILLAGSLSPVYLNNPSFKYFTMLDDQGQPTPLQDYELHFLDLAAENRGPGLNGGWTMAYRFREEYMGTSQPPAAFATGYSADNNQSGRALDAVAVAETVNRLHVDSRLAQLYLSRALCFTASQQSSTVPIADEVCATSWQFLGDYEACVTYRSSSDQ